MARAILPASPLAMPRWKSPVWSQECTARHAARSSAARGSLPGAQICAGVEGGLDGQPVGGEIGTVDLHQTEVDAFPMRQQRLCEGDRRILRGRLPIAAVGTVDVDRQGVVAAFRCEGCDDVFAQARAGVPGKACGVSE
jgi:hypothetical protein